MRRHRSDSERRAMFARLTVHRKGFFVKPHPLHRDHVVIHIKGHYVRPSTFEVEDRGMPGRGRKVIPPLKKGTLGVSTAHEPTAKLKVELVRRAEKIGEKKVVGKLGALAVLHKNTDPRLSRKERELQHYVAGSMIGKKRVKYPHGFKSKERYHSAYY